MNLNTATTDGIKVGVRSWLNDAYSHPENDFFMFSYRITIENSSNEKVQLLRRCWYIFDSDGERNRVYGTGVIGQQPILTPHDIYEYESGCHLNTTLGFMRGYYEMQRASDKQIFNVIIPTFELVVPHRLN